MLGTFGYRTRTALHRAGWSLAGITLILPGLAFLTAALWLLLSELRDALFAAGVIGALYLGLGLICLAMARRRPRIPLPPRHAVPPPPLAGGLAAELVAALMQGVTAGMAARAATRRPPPPPRD
ncbi:phage holin family protein [Oceanicola sp. S124]|uniref:phage holin family protein n=1 Tax=Oceanicola sp. S124 TaxID=1042378 RepID=UPI0002557E40|nr:phage holin family protein [Oceanicola sp. S124]